MMHTEKIDFGDRQYSLETGRMAKQADGSVLARLGDTMVLVTVVGASEPTRLSFFPLTVDYREKAYAAGKIPGGFFKREARPSEQEILSARLIDRSLRPLFEDGYMNEVQVLITVLSADRENNPDVVALTAASAALAVSDVPFHAIVAAVRVGRTGGNFIANPTFAQLENSDLDLIISGTAESIVMVEGESKEINEADMVSALEFGHEQIKQLVKMQSDLQEKAGKPKREWTAPGPDSELLQQVSDLVKNELTDVFSHTEKKARGLAFGLLKEKTQEALAEQFPEQEGDIAEAIHDLEKHFVRQQIATQEKRIDGRGLDDIREITCEVGVLPRAHGSALFTRGQTQSLGTVTLGTKLDEQKMDRLEGEFWKSYMLHYNFPPSCVGEIRPMRGTSRREVGHGNLAERAIRPAMPALDVFPYTVRVVSEVLESNGSSSMATVCSGTLALMDAGVPLKTPIAGIAMGLIKEDDKHFVLTDILGDEDHLGDMDFKVAGSETGVTAFQMDIKIKGIPTDVLAQALEKARQARLKILDVMKAVISEPRDDMSKYAPRITTVKVKVDQIGAIIGPGGKMIREITERSGATINIDDDGTVLIAATEAESSDIAKQMIEDLVREPERGKVYNGKVKKITNFGAFVEILPGKEGLLHISQIAHNRINRVEDVLKVGEQVEVKLLDIDPQGKLDLSRKVLLPREEEAH